VRRQARREKQKSRKRQYKSRISYETGMSVEGLTIDRAAAAHARRRDDATTQEHAPIDAWDARRCHTADALFTNALLTFYRHIIDARLKRH
jgi:hypothetical protein